MILSGHYQMSLAPLERLDPYEGTYDIVRTLSNVPSHWEQLIKPGRSLSIVGEMPQIQSEISPSPPHWGQLIMTSQYQMSLRHISGTIDIGWSLSNVLGQYHLSLGHYQMSQFSC